jgi:hypothetical protein
MEDCIVGKQIDISYKRRFEDLFDSLCAARSKFTAWNDCIHIWAYMISNSCDFRQDREDKYLAIIKQYTSKEHDDIAKLFALLAAALEENREQDFLGQLYMEYRFGDVKKGEYFTPYEIASMMSQLTGDSRENTEKYVSVNDPACGSGVMLIAYINQLIKNNQSPHLEALVVGSDLDPCIALMCYIQLSLLGAAGYVCIRNIIAEPMINNVLNPPDDAFITPLFFHPVWAYRKMRESMREIIHAQDENNNSGEDNHE